MGQRVLIVGAGEIGRALGQLLQTKTTNQVDYRDKDPSKTGGETGLSTLAPEAQFLLLCVPSWALREAAISVQPYLTAQTAIISLTKGLEGTLKTAPEVLAEVFGNDQPFALLGGPMIAEELNQEITSVGVVATTSLEIFNKIKNLFADTSLRVEYSDDLKGVALASVLKNIYAVGLGIADALGAGVNFKGIYTQKALVEMSQVIVTLGGKSETAYGLAGIGDLVATGFSSYSRNRRAGEELVKKSKATPNCEGIISLPLMDKLLQGKLENFPLLNTLKKLVVDGENPEKIFSQAI